MTDNRERLEKGPDTEAIGRLVDEGLLALINMAILWPRGLALRVTFDGTEVEFLDVWDAGEYVAGWIDTPKDQKRLHERMLALTRAEMARERVAVLRHVDWEALAGAIVADFAARPTAEALESIVRDHLGLDALDVDVEQR